MSYYPCNHKMFAYACKSYLRIFQFHGPENVSTHDLISLSNTYKQINITYDYTTSLHLLSNNRRETILRESANTPARQSNLLTDLFPELYTVIFSELSTVDIYRVANTSSASLELVWKLLPALFKGFALVDPTIKLLLNDISIRKPPKSLKTKCFSNRLLHTFISQMRRYGLKKTIRAFHEHNQPVFILNTRTRFKLNLRMKRFCRYYPLDGSGLFIRKLSHFSYRMLTYAHALHTDNHRLIEELKHSYDQPPQQDLNILNWIKRVFPKNADLDKINFSDILEGDNNERCLVYLTTLAFVFDYQRLLIPLLKLYCNHSVGKSHIFSVLRGYGGVQHVDLVFKHHPHPILYFEHVKKHRQLRSIYWRYPNPCVDRLIDEKIKKENKSQMRIPHILLWLFCFGYMSIIELALFYDLKLRSGKWVILSGLGTVLGVFLLYMIKLIYDDLNPVLPIHNLLDEIKIKPVPLNTQAKRMYRRLTQRRAISQSIEGEQKFDTSVLSQQGVSSIVTEGDNVASSQGPDVTGSNA